MVGGTSTTEDAGMSEYRVRNLADSTTFIERDGVSFMTDLARSDADALVPCSAIRKQSRRSCWPCRWLGTGRLRRHHGVGLDARRKTRPVTDSTAQPLVRVEERVPANQAAEFRAIIGPIAERMREQVQAGANPAAALTRAELATLVGSTVNELQQVENGPDRVQRGVGGEDWASDVLP